MMSKFCIIAAALRRLSNKLNSVCSTVAIVLTFLLLGLVMLQVVARYGFNTPPQWTEEAARFCMVWAGLLGSTVSFHGRNDPVLARPPRALLRKIPRWVSTIRAAGVCLFVLPILFYAPSFVDRQFIRETETLEINFALVVAIVPLWASVLVIHVIADVLNAEPDWLGMDNSE